MITMDAYEDRVQAFHPDKVEMALINQDHLKATAEILEALDLIHAVYGEHPEGRPGRAADRLYIELGRRVRLDAL